MAAPAAALHPIGHVPHTFSHPACGNASVGAEIYYPATVAGEGTPVAAPPPGGFPVVVFGHGYQMVVQAYQNVWEALVPEGYVVALPITEGGLFPNHGRFGSDLACTVARLRQEGVTLSSMFYGRIADTAAVMGHSMGGGASVLAAAADPGIDAVANLAAANTNPSAITAAAQVQVPTLVVAGSKDCVAPPAQHQLPIYGNTGGDCRSYVSITGASHCQFGANNSLCNLGEVFCSSPDISRGTQHQRVNELLVPWLAAVLRNDWNAWLLFQSRLAAAQGITSQQDCPVPPATPPQCSNGLDDDGDGASDWPDDGGCASAGDASERVDCDDGLDNDGDGLIDAGSGPGNDPGCLNTLVFSRENPACNDGVDNDGDGQVDWPADLQCAAAWGESESPPSSACGLLGIEPLLAAALGSLRRRRP